MKLVWSCKFREVLDLISDLQEQTTAGVELSTDLLLHLLQNSLVYCSSVGLVRFSATFP